MENQPYIITPSGTPSDSNSGVALQSVNVISQNSSVSSRQQDLDQALRNNLNQSQPSNFTNYFWLSNQTKILIPFQFRQLRLSSTSTQPSNPTDSVYIAAVACNGNDNFFHVKLHDLIYYNFSSWSVEGVIPDFIGNLNLNVKNLLFIWDKNSQSSSYRYIIAADIVIIEGLSLPQIPFPSRLTHSNNSSNSLDLNALNVVRLMYNNEDFKYYEIEGINNLLPNEIEGLPLPPKDKNDTNQPTSVILDKGFRYATHFDLGLSAKYSAALPIKTKDPDTDESSAVADYDDPSDHSAWLKIDKSFSILYLQKIGIQFPDPEYDNNFALLIDGGFSTKKGENDFSLYFDELAVRFDITRLPQNPAPTGISLKGISCDTTLLKGKVGLSAALEIFNVPPDSPEDTGYVQYAGYGKLKLDLKKLGVQSDRVGQGLEIALLANVIPNYGSSGATCVFFYSFIGIQINLGSVFKIQGFALGAGYNYYLKAPTVSEVDSFPLVQMAMNGVEQWDDNSEDDKAEDNKTEDNKGKDNKTGGNKTEGNKTDDNKTDDNKTEDDKKNTGEAVMEILSSLNDYLVPEEDEFFAAAGLKFTLYNYIDCFGLMMLDAGSSWRISLLGTANAKFPKMAKDSKKSPLCEIGFNILVDIDITGGSFTFAAQFTPGCYVLEKSCVLTGGIALAVWWCPSPHEGDWVFTAGGYHQKFRKPSYYPDCPRLGLDWLMCDGSGILPYVRATGSLYLALCGHAIMMGGAMSIKGIWGPVKAWASCGFDFLICWSPLYYDLSIYVGAGVSMIGITLSVSARIDIWGPDFGMEMCLKARIIFIHITIDFTFGDQSSRDAVPPIPWSDFQDQFLPTDATMCKLLVQQGITQQIDQDPSSPPEAYHGDELQPQLYVVNAEELQLSTDCGIPINTLLWGANASENGSTRYGHFSANDLANQGVNTRIAVQPVAVTHDNFKSIHKVSITKQETVSGDINWIPAEAHFNWEPILQPNAPAAQWGDPIFADRNHTLLKAANVDDPLFLENTMSGLSIKAGSPIPPQRTDNIPAEYLLQQIYNHPNVYNWLAMSAFATVSPSSSELNNSINNNSNRSQLLSEMGFSASDVTVNSNYFSTLLATPKVSR